MADDAVQAAIRAADANLDDADAIERVIAAHRRAGRSVPGRFLLAETFPARTLESELSAQVQVERVTGGVSLVGWTGGGRPTKLPRHRAWWLAVAEPLDPTELMRSVRRLGVEQPDLHGLELALRRGWPHELAPTIAQALPGLLALRLDLPPLDGSAHGLPALAGLRRLRRLRLRVGGSYVQSGAPLASWLAELPELAALELPSPHVDQLAHLPGALVRLAVPGLRPGWRARSDLPQVTTLEAPRAELDDDQLAELLAAWPGLEALGLRACSRLTGLAWLPGVPRLRRLDLTSTDIEPRALRHLVELPLESLALSRCAGLDDSALTHVAKLAGLRELELDHLPRVGSKGLLRLTRLERLERLSLRGNKATVAAHAKGREALAKALPGCKILYH